MNHPDTDAPLFILWTSGDPEVAHKAAFMYAHNSIQQGWWQQVRLIIWGPSAKLASEDPDIQIRLREMLDDGVEIWACQACADSYGVTSELKELGLNVFHVGSHLTEMLQSGWRQLTL